jgi:hypothetical protein
MIGIKNILILNNEFGHIISKSSLSTTLLTLLCFCTDLNILILQSIDKDDNIKYIKLHLPSEQEYRIQHVLIINLDPLYICILTASNNLLIIDLSDYFINNILINKLENNIDLNEYDHLHLDDILNRSKFIVDLGELDGICESLCLQSLDCSNYCKDKINNHEINDNYDVINKSDKEYLNIFIGCTDGYVLHIAICNPNHNKKLNQLSSNFVNKLDNEIDDKINNKMINKTLIKFCDGAINSISIDFNAISIDEKHDLFLYLETNNGVFLYIIKNNNHLDPFYKYIFNNSNDNNDEENIFKDVNHNDEDYENDNNNNDDDIFKDVNINLFERIWKNSADEEENELLSSKILEDHAENIYHLIENNNCLSNKSKHNNSTVIPLVLPSTYLKLFSNINEDNGFINDYSTSHLTLVKHKEIELTKYQNKEELISSNIISIIQNCNKILFFNLDNNDSEDINDKLITYKSLVPCYSLQFDIINISLLFNTTTTTYNNNNNNNSYNNNNVIIKKVFITNNDLVVFIESNVRNCKILVYDIGNIY